MSAHKYFVFTKFFVTFSTHCSLFQPLSIVNLCPKSVPFNSIYQSFIFITTFHLSQMQLSFISGQSTFYCIDFILFIELVLCLSEDVRTILCNSVYEMFIVVNTVTEWRLDSGTDTFPANAKNIPSCLAILCEYKITVSEILYEISMENFYYFCCIINNFLHLWVLFCV